MQDAFPVATAWVLLLVLAVIGVYDFFAAIYSPDGYTVSAYLYALSRKFPVVPVLVGLVIGHLFWPVHSSMQAHVKAIVREAERTRDRHKLDN